MIAGSVLLLFISVVVAYHLGRADAVRDKLGVRLEFFFWVALSASLCISTVYYFSRYGTLEAGTILRETIYNLVGAGAIAAGVTLYRLIFGTLPLQHLRQRLFKSPQAVAVQTPSTTPSAAQSETTPDPLKRLSGLAKASGELSERIFVRAGVYLFIGGIIALGGLLFFWMLADRGEKSAHSSDGSTDQPLTDERLREELSFLRTQYNYLGNALFAIRERDKDSSTPTIAPTPDAQHLSRSMVATIEKVVDERLAQLPKPESASNTALQDMTGRLIRLEASLQEFEKGRGIDIDIIVHYVRNFGILVFVELLAFFFLRQYRAAMDDFRYFEAIERRRCELDVLLRLMAAKGEIDIGRLLDANMFFSTAGKLSKGETTEWLEGRRLSKDELDLAALTIATANKAKLGN